QLRAARARWLGARPRADAVRTVCRRRADTLGKGRILFGAARAARPAAAADVVATRGRSCGRGVVGALSAPVHRAAGPLLPELVLQPIGADAPPPATTDRDDGGCRRAPARPGRWRPRKSLQRSRQRVIRREG